MSICVILTCTIDICGVHYTARNDTDIRHIDYQLALRKWLKNDYVNSFVIVENSGYDLSVLKNIVSEMNKSKQVEFISYYGQDFPRHLGKGYGEASALGRVISESMIFSKSEKFIKINGRYYIPNIDKFIETMRFEVDVMTELSKNLLWSDSRVFGGSSKFIRDYLITEGKYVNDSAGVYMEHALARATHRAIADGLLWLPTPCVPYIDGLSGTANKAYSQSWLRRQVKNIFIKSKAVMISI